MWMMAFSAFSKDRVVIPHLVRRGEIRIASGYPSPSRFISIPHAKARCIFPGSNG
jgi:hypothetical protein